MSSIGDIRPCTSGHGIPLADERPPAVDIRSVRKNYGRVTALDGVTLTIRRGEFFSLLGPSGCGKTTLLRIIGGFEDLNEGQVLIDGKDCGSSLPYARNTNMIFQHLALFPHMNVFENVAFGLRRKNVPKPQIIERVRSVLALIRLEEYGQRMIDQLSGGQKQRVAMARALVNDPAVLLLDEPLGALDLQLRLQMQDELRRLQRSLGNTFIYVTHDQGEAMTMSDRIAVMNGGQISANRHACRDLREASNSLCRLFHRAHELAERNRCREAIDRQLPGGLRRIALSLYRRVLA